MRANQQWAWRKKQETREEGPTEWHSGNNLLNLLLHLPAIAPHPEPHPVAHCEKAKQDSDGCELEGRTEEDSLPSYNVST